MYSGMTTRLKTISPLSSMGLTSDSGIFGGKSPERVFSGMTITLSEGSVSDTGTIATFWMDTSPGMTSTPSMVMVRYPAASTRTLYSL